MIRSSVTNEGGVSPGAKQLLWLLAIGLGVVYLAAAYAGIYLTRHAGNIASLWPPNAIMLAVLLGWPSLPRLPAFASCALANMLANILHADPLPTALGFTLANMIEVGIPLVFVHWMGCGKGYVSDLNSTLILALGVLIGVAVASPIGAAVVTLAYGAPWSDIVATWLAADLAGMLIFAPPILCFGSDRNRKPLLTVPARSRREWALVGSAFIASFVIVFVSQDYASPYLFIPVLLWLAARFGPALTVIACTAIAVTASAATIGGGWDIFGLSDRGIREQILDLQIFIAVAVVSFLPLAILFRERDDLFAKLKAREERYSLMVRGSGAGIWTWEAATDQLLWSDRLKEIVGISDDDFEPDVSSFMSRLHPDDHVNVLEARRRHLSEREPYDIECRLRREDGSYIWIHNRGQAVWNESGEATRMAGSAEDITARKVAEAERAQYACELERSNQELDDFAYIASHDLKEPLRAIYNHAGFLLEDYSDRLEEDGKKRLHRLIELSQRMECLIADLLHYARLGRNDQSTEIIDLNTVISDIEGNFAETLQERNARIVVATPLPHVTGHHPHMTAIFQNLISNGIKYNDTQEKIIEIGLVPSEKEGSGNDAPTIYVRDNGIGIPDQFRDDVFLIFKRLNSEKAYGPGTGAGLSFVRKIVECLDGNIWLTSAPSEGTTFFLTLPPGKTSPQADAGDQAA